LRVVAYKNFVISSRGRQLLRLSAKRGYCKGEAHEPSALMAIPKETTEKPSSNVLPLASNQ